MGDVAVDCSHLKLTDPRHGECIARRYKELLPSNSADPLPKPDPYDADAVKKGLDAYIPPTTGYVSTPGNAGLRVHFGPNFNSDSLIDKTRTTVGLDGPGMVAKIDILTKGAMTINTDIETGTPAARIWQKIVAASRARGNTDEELFKAVNVGFTEDPNLRSREYNRRGLVEAAEVFEYAYAHPEFWPDLAREKIPIPFSFIDFNPATSDDDLLWREVEAWDRDTAMEIAQRLKSEGDDYRRALAQAIFDDTLRRLPKKGDRSFFELANLLYARYQAAGLQPQFVSLRRWEPSLHWLGLIHNNVLPQDNVLLAIPLQNGGRMQLNLATHSFDARFSTATPITLRQYTAIWLNDHIEDLLRKGRFDSDTMSTAQGWVAKTLEIAPQSMAPLINGLALYMGMGDWKGADTVMAKLGALAPEGPETLFLRSLLVLHRQDKSIAEREEELKELDKKKPDMLKKFPDVCAYFLYLEGMSNLVGLKHYLISNQKNSDPGLVQRATQFTTETFSTSLKARPGNPFALKGLLEAISVVNNWEQGVAVFGELLEAHPSYPAFRYAAALSNFGVWQNSGQKDAVALTQARMHINKFVESEEPNNPRAYILAADIMRANGQGADALSLLRRGMPLWKADEPWAEYYLAYLKAIPDTPGNVAEFRDVFRRGVAAHGESFALEVRSLFPGRI